MNKEQKNEQSKLGKILKGRGLTQKEFGRMVYEQTGYFIAPQNISNLCSGFRSIKKISTAQLFADTLGVDVNEIL